MQDLTVLEHSNSSTFQQNHSFLSKFSKYVCILVGIYVAYTDKAALNRIKQISFLNSYVQFSNWTIDGRDWFVDDKFIFIKLENAMKPHKCSITAKVSYGKIPYNEKSIRRKFLRWNFRSRSNRITVLTRKFPIINKKHPANSVTLFHLCVRTAWIHSEGWIVVVIFEPSTVDTQHLNVVHPAPQRRHN